MSAASALRHDGRAALAILLRQTKTCRAVRRSDGAAVVYVRWRPWCTEALIPAGNALLALIGEPVRFLPRRQWLAWETQAYANLAGVQVDMDIRGRLLVPGFRGTVLADFLCCESYGHEQKIAAFQAAVESLRQAHAAPILWPDGVVRPFSHGDATARNVVFDPETAKAVWIDFETIHAPSLALEERRADDLRALVWSAAECVGPEHFDVLCRAIVTVYRDHEVLSCLYKLPAKHVRPNLYHLAQGFLLRNQDATLVASLREHLRDHKSRTHL